MQVGCFDENATQFYSAEITVALEYLHNIGIIHRSVELLLNVHMKSCDLVGSSHPPTHSLYLQRLEAREYLTGREHAHSNHRLWHSKDH